MPFVSLILDGDEAGRRATAVVRNRLDTKMDVSVVTLHAGQQPDQLAFKEMNEVLHAYVKKFRGLGR